VFVENYRGSKIADLGLSPEELAARRPGIAYASGRCYSYDGPWASRGGFDMEALCVTGFTTEEGAEWWRCSTAPVPPPIARSSHVD
jgi:crotonobetainyl-CoA:carnitine CoA-transferase CaiB-like acyl-CoA transferase